MNRFTVGALAINIVAITLITIAVISITVDCVQNVSEEQLVYQVHINK